MYCRNAFFTSLRSWSSTQCDKYDCLCGYCRKYLSLFASRIFGSPNIRKKIPPMTVSSTAAICVIHSSYGRYTSLTATLTTNLSDKMKCGGGLVPPPHYTQNNGFFGCNRINPSSVRNPLCRFSWIDSAVSKISWKSTPFRLLD